MELTQHQKGKATIFELQGRLDSNAAPEVEKQIMAAINGGASGIVLNFHELEYISSAGIRALVHCNKACENKGEKVLLASVPKAIENVLYITGFLPYFEIYDTPDHAAEKIK